MAPSPAARWPLLGLALCLCLLLGHAHGAEEEEEAQPQLEDPNGGAGRRTLPPFLLPGWREKSDSLPTVERNGDLYFDVAAASETHLEIPESGRRVGGVTATSGRCVVQSLVLGRGFLLDEDLFTHCPLKSIRLKGKKWRCLQEGRLLQRPGLAVDAEGATCSDAWHYSSKSTAIVYGVQEGIQKFQEFGITGCLIDECACKWYFTSGAYNMSMDCEGRGLTDDDLAGRSMRPGQVTIINFEKNNLTSMDTLIEYLRPNHQELKVLSVGNNQLTALPRLGHSFPRIIDISLVNNAIEKIDLQDFKDLMSREGLFLSLPGNPFRCDNMYDFKVIIHRLCIGGWKFCNTYLRDVTCNGPDGEPVPLYKVSEDANSSKVDWWLFLNIALVLLNLFIIYLMLDLILILANPRGSQVRRPKMDYLVCFLKTAVCCLCRGAKGATDKDD